jgi:HK97 family phage major capsid protein
VPAPHQPLRLGEASRKKQNEMNAFELERRELQRHIDSYLSKGANLTASERKACDLLLAKFANLRSEDERISKFNSVADSVGIPRIALPTEEQRTAQRDNDELRDYLVRRKEARTYTGLQVATDSLGGYYVPQTFYDGVTFALKQADGLWNGDVVTLWEDIHGNSATFPLIDDTGTVAVQVGEEQTSSESEIAEIDKLTLSKIPTWRSKKLITSIELLQDSAFPVEQFVSSAVASRFQRGISAANASTLISSLTSGATSASATAVGLDDTLELLASLDPAYLNQPKTFFGMNFQTLVSLLKLKDTSGRYQWHPRTDANGRLLLHNIPVVVMPSLPSAAANAAGTVVLGDFSRCVRRIIKGSMRLMRYTQADNLAENGLVAYEGFLRTSFGVLTSSNITNPPIKFLTQAAS